MAKLAREIVIVGAKRTAFGTMGGALKALTATDLAVHAAKRSASLPQVPTFQEAGLPPLAADTWFGLLAPAGTPKATLQAINTELRAILESPVMKSRMESLSMSSPMDGPEKFAEFLANDYKVWGELVRSTGAKLD